MPKKRKLWSVARITDPRFPGVTLRVTELTRGGKLYYVYMKNGRQKMKCLQLGPSAQAFFSLSS